MKLWIIFVAGLISLSGCTATINVVSEPGQIPEEMGDNDSEMMEMAVSYSIGETRFAGVVVWPADEEEPMPGVLMVPNWMGPTEASLEKAKMIAEEDLVVFMVDMYGTDVRPTNSQEAGRAAGVVRADRELMRERIQRAHLEFRQLEGIPLDPERMAAIGFCFGGGTVLEYARTGVELDAIVSFHGDLLSPTLADDAANVKSPLLVLHGADDPYVPQDHVQEFIQVMQQTGADWQLVQFSGTVHSFTDPLATATGQAEYNPVSAARAFEMMEELFEEQFEDDD